MQRLVERRRAHAHQEGAEDLLGRDPCVRRLRHHDGRSDEPALVRDVLALQDDLAFVPREVLIPPDAFVRVLVDQRTDHRRRLARRPDRNDPRRADNAFDQRIEDRTDADHP